MKDDQRKAMFAKGDKRGHGIKSSDLSTKSIDGKQVPDEIIYYSQGVRIDPTRENHTHNRIGEVAVSPERIDLETTNLGDHGTRFTLKNAKDTWSMDIGNFPVFTEEDQNKVQRLVDIQYRNQVGIHGFKTVRDQEKFRDSLELKIKKEFHDIPIENL